MMNAPHPAQAPSRKRWLAGIAALALFCTGLVQAAPDGSFSAAEKTRIKQEIGRIGKLNQTSCMPVENTLRGLETDLAAYEATYKEYFEAYQKQRQGALALWRPFLPAGEYAKQTGAAADTPADPSVVDDFNALVKEARAKRLYTETGPMDGDKPGETVNWVLELEYAWEKWREGGSVSPSTQDPRYFFEAPEQLSGNAKAFLGPLAQTRKDLLERQSRIHDRYRLALADLRNQLDGARLSDEIHFANVMASDYARLDDLRNRRIPQWLETIQAQAGSGSFEHCYGFPPAQAGKSVGQLPWLIQAGALAQVPKLEPLPLPNADKLPQQLPRVLLKADGVEQYLRAMKMFSEQAKVDLEYSKLSLLNVVEGIYDIGYQTGAHIADVVEFLTKAGIKVGDTAIADVQALVNLGAYGIGIEDAAFWDPTGAVERNKQWAGQLNKAVVGLGRDIKDVCATQPPEACVAASILLPVMKPMFAAMTKVGEAMPAINESAGDMAAALFTSQEDLVKATNLSDFQFVRDRAAKIEEGAASLRKTTGVIAGEAIMGLALATGIAHLPAKGGKVTDAAALYESCQRSGKQALNALDRLDKAAGKVDDIARAVSRGDLTAVEAKRQLAKVGETLRLNKREFDAATRLLPQEAREALAKTYARGVDDLRARTKTALNEPAPEVDLIDDDLFGGPVQSADKLGELDVGFLKKADDIGQGLPRAGEPPAPQAAVPGELINPKLDGLAQQLDAEAAFIELRKAELEAQALAASGPEADRLMEAALQLGKPVSTAGTRIVLDLPGLTGEFTLGRQLGSGSFKTAYRLLAADGSDTGKVIAILNQKGEGLKAFFASEGYADDILKEIGGKVLQTDELVRLPNGDWAIVMDNFDRLGLKVGDGLVADELARNLRGKFLTDPALRTEAEAWASRNGKTLEQLTGKDCEQIAQDMALRQRNRDFFAEAREQEAYKGLSDEQIRDRFIAEGKADDLPKSFKDDVADFAEKQLGLTAKLPEEAQEAAFKLLLKQARAGVVDGDFKPGNLGFGKTDGGLEAHVTDKGGLYLVDDTAVREVAGITGAVDESQRARAALSMYAENTSEIARGTLFGSRSVPATADAIGQTFDDPIRAAIEALSRDLNADISGIVGGDLGRRLNAYAREVFQDLPASNRLLDKMGQGLQPGSYTGHKGFDPVPASADEFLAAKEAVKSPAKVDVAKSKAAEDALKRAEEQKVAKQLDEAGSQEKIKEGMCDQIQSRLLGGATPGELEDMAGRGFGCDINLDELLHIEPGGGFKLPELELPGPGSGLVLPWRPAANASRFAIGRAA